MRLIPLLQHRFEQALDGWVDDAAQHAQRIAVARDPRHGDYQANIAMPLRKQLGSEPMEIAARLVERLEVSDICHPPEIAKPGFINLRLKDEYLAEQLQAALADERLGVGTLDPQTWVIDYSSPNVAKPMHVGHIRTTVIGDALARVLRFLGQKVITDNHLGDWGTQFGMIIYGYKHFLDEAAYQQDPVNELSRLYRVVQSVIGYQASVDKLPAANERVVDAEKRLESLHSDQSLEDKKRKKALKTAEKDVRSARDTVSSLQAKVAAVQDNEGLLEIAVAHPDIQRSAQLETAKLHEGDEQNLALWRQFVPISIQEIESVYSRLHVEFDHTLGESFYQPMLAEVVAKLQDSGLARENDGAMCVFLDGFEAPMLIQKRDGAFLYATTDLATIEYRMREFHPHAILYVVDHRQSEHFEKLFAAARQMGYRDVELTHVSFGTVLGKDGRPFKTRSGDVMGLEYLLDEAVDRAYQVVCNPERLAKAGLDLSETEKKSIAEAVGIGAIKYADLSHNRTSDYKFDIDEMVQLEGDTAAYIQYMVARTRGIFLRAGVDEELAAVRQTNVVISHPAERALVLQLLQLEDALLQTIDEYYPSVLAGYLYGVAKQFAAFFDQCHVVNAPSEELKWSRLAICLGVNQVLELGLQLLGIQAVQRM